MLCTSISCGGHVQSFESIRLLLHGRLLGKDRIWEFCSDNALQTCANIPGLGQIQIFFIKNIWTQTYTKLQFTMRVHSPLVFFGGRRYPLITDAPPPPPQPPPAWWPTTSHAWMFQLSIAQC